jgi:hypothetical protein
MNQRIESTANRPTARRVERSDARERGCVVARTRSASECRWIDETGHEWLLRREDGSLIIERPRDGGSVVIRFPDLAAEALDGPPSDAWVLFCTADGYLIHCSICQKAETIDFSNGNIEGGHPNHNVSTYLDREELGG